MLYYYTSLLLYCSIYKGAFGTSMLYYYTTSLLLYYVFKQRKVHQVVYHSRQMNSNAKYGDGSQTKCGLHSRKDLGAVGGAVLETCSL